MKINTKVKRIGLIFGFVISSVTVFPQLIETQLNITAIRSDKGQLILNVFKDSETYEQQKPYKKIVVNKRGLSDGNMLVKLNIEVGTYGITLVDDENANDELDKNFVRIPKEGFGFSNFFMEKMAKPSFGDFKVKLQTPGNNVVIKVKYM